MTGRNGLPRVDEHTPSIGSRSKDLNLPGSTAFHYTNRLNVFPPVLAESLLLKFAVQSIVVHLSRYVTS